MVILKHGKVVNFQCDACGCSWLANRLEIEEDNDPEASVEASMHIRFYMKCPDCGMTCMTQRDRTKWDGDLSKWSEN